MDIRDSFSRLKKKLKHPLTGNRRGTGRTGVGAGDRVDPTDSLPLPKPNVADRDREGHGANKGGQQVRLTDRPPQPDELEPEPTNGNGNGQTEREGKGVCQKNSHPNPNVEVAVGNGRGGEGGDDSEEKVGRVYPSPSAPSIPLDGGPDSM